jgi:glycosyltransferase involved in cell wall biosynthesis
MDELIASVVIPTFNRIDSLRRLLESLDRQTMNSECYEVIVVDDGSTYDPGEITNQPFRFALTYLRQENRGATAARNNGAQQTRGQVLIFIDDDITVSEKTLEALVEECTRSRKVVAVGKLIACNINLASSFTKLAIEEENKRWNIDLKTNQPINFVACNTQLLAVKRADFVDLGMLQDPTGGWPNWDDVDFGYRSYLAGFQLIRVPDAVGEHWDYSLSNLKSATSRWFRASQTAVRLFQKYPDLRQSIPMFTDMTPINWRHDPSRLIVRKCLRKLVSSGFILVSMEYAAGLFDRYYPSPRVLRPLYRWIEGAYKYRGYRQGLREFGSVPEPRLAS